MTDSSVGVASQSNPAPKWPRCCITGLRYILPAEVTGKAPELILQEVPIAPYSGLNDEAFKHWRAYLESVEDIIIYTNHKNLEYFTISMALNRRQARWAELLAHLGKFKIIYQPGPKMGKPNALTRRQDLQGGSKAAEAPPHKRLKPGQFIITLMLTSFTGAQYYFHGLLGPFRREAHLSLSEPVSQFSSTLLCRDLDSAIPRHRKSPSSNRTVSTPFKVSYELKDLDR